MSPIFSNCDNNNTFGVWYLVFSHWLMQWKQQKSLKKLINALSFYWSKIILDHPNDFGKVPIVMDGSNLFWSGPNHFGLVEIIKISPEKSNLNLTKMIWTWPKQFVPVQNNLDDPKSFWTYRRTRHNNLVFWNLSRQWARTVMIVERGIAPKERLRQQDLYAERMQTGEKALVLKQTMTVILILKFKK